MQNINNSEEVINPLSSIIRSLNIIDTESLQTEDIISINRNIDDYNAFFTTQQAEFINYSKFSEHVFFDSAVNKVVWLRERGNRTLDTGAYDSVETHSAAAKCGYPS